MKNRSRPFHCAIAGKTVGIVLRHGAGLQEPAHVYVRCDERDCQYVDLNVPPCPLHVEMFADGSERRTAEYLVRRAGTRVCYTCLTDELDITHEQVRRASWRLKDEPGFSIRPSRCMLCHHRRVTIALDSTAPTPVFSSPLAHQPLDRGLVDTLARHLRDRGALDVCAHCLARELHVPAGDAREAMFALESEPAFHMSTARCVSCLLAKRVIRYEERTADHAPRRVIGVLVQAGGPLCATCVAFAADLPLAETRRVLQVLTGVDEFRRADAVCETCGRWQMTIGFRGDGETDAKRMEKLTEVLTGFLRHRGFRIDLRSFKTPEGWRPLALIKSGAGTLVPDVPAIVLDVASTRMEADELAAAQAIAWIDKRVP